MRRIVLYISFMVGIVACSDSGDIEHVSSSVASLWSYVRQCTVPITEELYIEGYVVANDKYGEVYKTIVVDDNSAGVAIELDMEDIDRLFPMFSRVQISCEGLWLGCVGPKLILGAEPAADYVVDRLPAAKVQNHITVLPYSNDTPTYRRKTIAELEYRDMLCYVAIEGLNTISEEQGLLWCDIDPLTNMPITTVRHLSQGRDTLLVVTEAKCHYATEQMPTSKFNLSGILDFYGAEMVIRATDCGVEQL